MSTSTRPPEFLGFIHEYIPGDDQAPVLLLLHGTGGNEHDLLDLGRALAPASSLLSPRGKILEHGMPRFFRRLAEGVFDEADLIHRTHELADFVQAAAQVYGFDPKRVVALGYSNGANIAASMLFLRPETLAGAVLLRAMVPLVPPAAPALPQARILISAGESDPMIPQSSTKELAQMLQSYGATVDLHWNRAGHQLTSQELDVAKQWITTNFPANSV